MGLSPKRKSSSAAMRWSKQSRRKRPSSGPNASSMWWAKVRVRSALCMRRRSGSGKHFNLVFAGFDSRHLEEEFMQSSTQTASVSKKSLWVGLIISTLIVLFLLFDGGVKVIKMASAAEATVHVGYPARLVVPIGIAELICVALFVFPRTSILGAILLTGYWAARPLPKSGWKIHG